MLCSRLLWSPKHAVKLTWSLDARVKSNRSFFTCSSCQQLLGDLAAEHGAQLRVTLATSQYGQCLQVVDGAYVAQEPSNGSEGAAPYIRVPLSLVLSDEIPGCCQQAVTSAQLDDVLNRLRTNPEHDRWELRLAAMLLWAVRQEQHTFVCGFWARYTTLIPTLDHQTSLLTFSSQELQLLQHTELAAAAHQWQQTVTAAYKAAIMGHAAFSFARLPPPTPADYLWAVASAESRAFGIKVNGTELHAFVPFFDLANHSAQADTFHELDPSGTCFDLYSRGQPGDTRVAAKASASSTAAAKASASSTAAAKASASSTAAAKASASSTAAAPATQKEFFISYGKRSNAELMEQYGFVLPGNPLDQLSFEGASVGSNRLRQGKLAAAVQQLLCQAGAAGAAGPIGSADSPASSTQHNTAPEVSQHAAWFDSHDAAQGRLQAAAASIAQGCGWRSAAEYRAITAESEQCCISALVDWCQQQLAMMPSTVEEDKALLGLLSGSGDSAAGECGAVRDGFGAGAGGSGAGAGVNRSRAQAAVQCRLERKLLLHSTIALLKQLQATHSLE